jgi:hypothetical protein
VVVQRRLRHTTARNFADQLIPQHPHVGHDC